MTLKDIVGLTHFAEYFAAFRDHYVVIGGVATIFCLESSGLPLRPTRDIDLVVLANPNREFADVFRKYVSVGRYEIEGDAAQSSQNYRFRKPELAEFPLQIEIFSTVPIDLKLREGQRIVPFTTSPGLQSLSAIFMSTDYFTVVKENITQDEDVPLLTVDGLVPLKARAFLDLSERRHSGERVDKKEINKHRNDVFRLAASIPEAQKELPDSVGSDLLRFFEHPEITGLSQKTIQDITKSAEMKLEILKSIILSHFNLL